MIYTLTDFICLDISILLAFLVFCLVDFINICKSKIDTISKSNLTVYHKRISLPDSRDSKNPSFGTHA